MIEYENLRKLNEPFFSEYQERFHSVLESGWFILGKEVAEFEDSFAKFCQSHFCAGTANGLDALTLALMAFNFEPGQEVIVPSNTYIATILSILNCRLKPVLVEPDIQTYNIDPDKIEAAITKKTVAIMVVHLYGKCCEMEKISSIGKQHDLRIIEDCAQAHGARIKNSKAGTFGDLAAFSFYPTKNLGALGDGGCVNTNSAELDRKIRMLRNYGSERKYYNEIIGTNSRLDEVQAAFLNVKLRHLEEINDHKRALAAIYQKNLKEDFVKPNVNPDYHDVYHIYNVRHPRRDQLRKYLQENGVGSEIHYPVPPHRQKAMEGVLVELEFPVADLIHSTTISLPVSPIHSENDIQKVIEIMNRF